MNNSPPNCYECKHRLPLQYNTNSKCLNRKAKAVSSLFADKNGLFWFPYDYNPEYLVTCNGYIENKKKV